MCLSFITKVPTLYGFSHFCCTFYRQETLSSTVWTNGALPKLGSEFVTMFRAIYTVNHTFSPFQGEKKDRIEDEIKTHLVRIIRQNCTMCYDLTTAFLRKGSFLCQRNPTHFTYRSTLVNPFPTTNSSELLGIIQNWVSSGPSLVLDGLSVRVNRHCPTRIESLEDGECENEAMYDPHMVELMTRVLSACTVREIGHQLCTGI